jgi:hypothetical protein
MLEIPGIFAIEIVLTGSVLMALFAAEALIKWTIHMMSLGVHRADEAAATRSGQAQPVRILSGQRPRLLRI